MRLRELHSWEVLPREAVAIQNRVRERLLLEGGPALEEVRFVAGADCSYRRADGATVATAAIVVLSFPDLDVVETRVASRCVTFPYVPGLLAFREAPALIEAFREVERTPDVVLFDAHGIAHPRRLGLASHLGVLLDLPTIGCAKTHLVGHAEEPARERGAWTPLVDRGEIVGAAVRTRAGRAPLFVSPGHRIGVERAVTIALACCRGAFLPEPIRLADALAKEQGRRWQRVVGSSPGEAATDL